MEPLGPGHTPVALEPSYRRSTSQPPPLLSAAGTGLNGVATIKCQELQEEDQLSPKLRTAWHGGCGGGGCEEWPVPRAWPFSKCGGVAEGSTNVAQIRNRLLLPRKMQGKRSPSGGGDGEHLLMMDSPGKWSVRWRKTEKPPERGGLGRQRLSHRFGEHLRDDG